MDQDSQHSHETDVSLKTYGLDRNMFGAFRQRCLQHKKILCRKAIRLHSECISEKLIYWKVAKFYKTQFSGEVVQSRSGDICTCSVE